MNQIEQDFNRAKELHNNKEYEQSNKILLNLPNIQHDYNMQSIVALNFLYLEDISKALNFAHKSLSLNAHNGFCYYVLGNIYYYQKNMLKSIDYYNQALKYAPQEAYIYNQISECYDSLNDVGNLKKYLKKSLSIDNYQVGVLKKIAYIKGKECNYHKSISYYRHLLSFDKSEDIYHLLGLAYVNTLDYEKAIHYFHKSISTYVANNPNNYKDVHTTSYYNMGVSYHKLGYFDRAKASYLHVLALNPYHINTNWSLSILYLLTGDFKSGWRKYEWRKKMPMFKTRTHGLLENTPEYDGQNLDNKTLSIHSEQGYGDTIQFARFISFILEYTNVAKIVFRVHTTLYKLLQQLNSDRCQVYPEGYKYVQGVRADYQIALMSIPAFFDISMSDIDHKKYLKSSNHILLKQETNKLNVGIAWSGNEANTNNSLRSIPLAQLEGILSNKKINFYSLHLSDINEDIAKFGYEKNITDLSDKMKDFNDTASIIEQLDFVITVDTVIAHLSGALGIKTYLLLQYSPDFRWMLERSDCIWYESMEIFRQKTFNDYSQPIAELRASIENILDFRQEEFIS